MGEPPSGRGWHAVPVVRSTSTNPATAAGPAALPRARSPWRLRSLMRVSPGHSSAQTTAIYREWTDSRAMDRVPTQPKPSAQARDSHWRSRNPSRRMLYKCSKPTELTRESFRGQFRVHSARRPAMRATGLTQLSSQFLIVALAAAAPAHAQRSHAMAQECRGARSDNADNRQRAEQWVQDRLKAF